MTTSGRTGTYFSHKSNIRTLRETTYPKAKFREMTHITRKRVRRAVDRGTYSRVLANLVTRSLIHELFFLGNLSRWQTVHNVRADLFSISIYCLIFLFLLRAFGKATVGSCLYWRKKKAVLGGLTRIRCFLSVTLANVLVWGLMFVAFVFGYFTCRNFGNKIWDVKRKVMLVNICIILWSYSICGSESKYSNICFFL